MTFGPRFTQKYDWSFRIFLPEVGNTTEIHGTPIVVLNTSIHGGILPCCQEYGDCVFVTTLAGSDQVYLISVHLCSWELGALASPSLYYSIWVIASAHLSLGCGGYGIQPTHIRLLRIKSIFLMHLGSHFPDPFDPAIIWVCRKTGNVSKLRTLLRQTNLQSDLLASVFVQAFQIFAQYFLSGRLRFWQMIGRRCLGNQFQTQFVHPSCCI